MSKSLLYKAVFLAGAIFAANVAYDWYKSNKAVA